MRRTDFHSVPPTGLPALSPAVLSRTAHLAAWEQRTSTHRVGDRRDEPPADWEAAWIDLGGEG